MTQLKISDLSVGDWVRDKEGTPAKILGIEQWSGEYYLNVEVNGADVGNVIAEGALPIPITPEILEKNGWEYETYTIEDINGDDIEYKCYRHKFYRDSYRHDIVLEDSYGGYYQCSIERSIPDEAGELRFISVLCSLDFVEYLHQLQHALRLAGVEKEIVL